MTLLLIGVGEIKVFDNLARNSKQPLLYRIFGAYFIYQKINDYLLYSHVGIRRVWNFRSNEVWCSPCKLRY
jgi:hypothetical protein